MERGVIRKQTDDDMGGCLDCFYYRDGLCDFHDLLAVNPQQRVCSSFEWRNYN